MLELTSGLPTQPNQLQSLCSHPPRCAAPSYFPGVLRSHPRPEWLDDADQIAITAAAAAADIIHCVVTICQAFS